MCELVSLLFMKTKTQQLNNINKQLITNYKHLITHLFTLFL